MGVINSIDEWNVASQSMAAHRLQRLIDLESEHRQARLRLVVPPNLNYLRNLMIEFLNEMAPSDSLTDWKFEAFLQWARRRQENTDAKKSD